MKNKLLTILLSLVILISCRDDNICPKAGFLGRYWSPENNKSLRISRDLIDSLEHSDCCLAYSSNMDEIIYCLNGIFITTKYLNHATGETLVCEFEKLNFSCDCIGKIFDPVVLYHDFDVVEYNGVCWEAIAQGIGVTPGLWLENGNDIWIECEE